MSDEQQEEEVHLPVHDLIGHLVNIERPTTITRDCTCNAKNRLARSDHSPTCLYSQDTIGLTGVVWEARSRLSEDGQQQIEVETVEGLGIRLDDTFEIELLDEIQLEGIPGKMIASLEMISRAASDLVLARIKLVRNMEETEDDEGHADFNDAGVIRAGKRAEEAFNTLALLVMNKSEVPGHTGNGDKQGEE